MSDAGRDLGLPELVGDFENDFESWARLSARLVDLPEAQRQLILDKLELVEEWGRLDEHWSDVMSEELRAGDPTKMCRHGELCADELARRQAASGAEAGGLKTDSRAGGRAELDGSVCRFAAERGRRKRKRQTRHACNARIRARIRARTDGRRRRRVWPARADLSYESCPTSFGEWCCRAFC